MGGKNNRNEMKLNELYHEWMIKLKTEKKNCFNFECEAIFISFTYFWIFHDQTVCFQHFPQKSRFKKIIIFSLIIFVNH